MKSLYQYFNKSNGGKSFDKLQFTGDYFLQQNLKTKEVYFKCNTIMLKGEIEISKGAIDAKKIFLENTSTVCFGKNFKISGEVYILSSKDFDKIFRFETDEMVDNFLKENIFKPTEAIDTNFNSVYDNLKNNYYDHYGEDIINVLHPCY